MYLGELTRLIIVDAIKKDILGLPLDVFRYIHHFYLLLKLSGSYLALL